MERFEHIFVSCTFKGMGNTGEVQTLTVNGEKSSKYETITGFLDEMTSLGWVITPISSIQQGLSFRFIMQRSKDKVW